MSDENLLCSACRVAESDPAVGYCAACEATIALAIDGAYESLFPLVLGAREAASPIARVLWRLGWRLEPRAAPRVPMCRNCRSAEVDLAAAESALATAVETLAAARERDARSGGRLGKSDAFWITLCGQLNSHIYEAAFQMTGCKLCIANARDHRGPRLVRV